MNLFKPFIVFGLFLFQCFPNTAIAILSIDTIEPRQYGYVLGDVFKRKIVLNSRNEHSIFLDEKKTLGRINNWLSIRKINLKRTSKQSHLIEIQYQIVNVPSKPLMVVVPGFQVTVLNKGFKKKIISSELMVTLAPITPAIVVNRGGLLNIQANNASPQINTDNILSRIILWLTFLILPMLVLLYCWAPWHKFFFKENLPFSHADLRIKNLENSSDLIFWRESLTLLHFALNTTAKKTVFIGSLDNFLLEHYQYKKFSKSINYFLLCSRKLFYEDESFPNASEKLVLMKLIRQMALTEKKLS